MGEFWKTYPVSDVYSSWNALRNDAWKIPFGNPSVQKTTPGNGTFSSATVVEDTVVKTGFDCQSEYAFRTFFPWIDSLAMSKIYTIEITLMDQ